MGRLSRARSADALLNCLQCSNPDRPIFTFTGSPDEGAREGARDGALERVKRDERFSVIHVSRLDVRELHTVFTRALLRLGVADSDDSETQTALLEHFAVLESPRQAEALAEKYAEYALVTDDKVLTAALVARIAPAAGALSHTGDADDLPATATRLHAFGMRAHNAWKNGASAALHVSRWTSSMPLIGSWIVIATDYLKLAPEWADGLARTADLFRDVAIAQTHGVYRMTGGSKPRKRGTTGLAIRLGAQPK